MVSTTIYFAFLQWLVNGTKMFAERLGKWGPSGHKFNKWGHPEVVDSSRKSGWPKNGLQQDLKKRQPVACPQGLWDPKCMEP